VALDPISVIRLPLRSFKRRPGRLIAISLIDLKSQTTGPELVLATPAPGSIPDPAFPPKVSHCAQTRQSIHEILLVESLYRTCRHSFTQPAAVKHNRAIEE
jgi:hypothetical protein